MPLAPRLKKMEKRRLWGKQNHSQSRTGVLLAIITVVSRGSQWAKFQASLGSLRWWTVPRAWVKVPRIRRSALSQQLWAASTWGEGMGAWRMAR